MVNNEAVLTDIFRLMVGTPNTPTQRTYSVNYSFNRNTNQVILDMQTPFKTARMEGELSLLQEAHFARGFIKVRYFMSLPIEIDCTIFPLLHRCLSQGKLTVVLLGHVKDLINNK